MYRPANDPRTGNDPQIEPQMILHGTGNDPQIGPQMIPDRLTIDIEWNGLKFRHFDTFIHFFFFVFITSRYIKLSGFKFYNFKNYNVAAQCNKTIYFI